MIQLIEHVSPEAWGISDSLSQSRASFIPRYKFNNTPFINPLNAYKLVRTWSEREDSFTQSNLLNNAEELFELIQIFKEIQFVTYRESLANRLMNLFNEAKDEDHLSVGINIDSLRYFYRFLQSNSKLKCPIITLTPELDIYLTWGEGKIRLFSVHFLPNGDTHFVIFMQNDKNPEQTDHFYGKTTYDTLIENVERFGLNDLISE